MNPTEVLQSVKVDEQQLWQDDVVWVPIRHHSPACAYALRILLREIKPETILIEGPRDCSNLIGYCQAEDTKPPVAFLSQKGKDENLYTAYFPLCEYSPEWVAMRTALEFDTTVALIDLPYDHRTEFNSDQKVQSLMEESYLNHSLYLQAIAKQLSCRDHHEGWDRLFEQRTVSALSDWRSFFRDVYIYCSLARLDYDQQVLEANGDMEREAHMFDQIQQYRSKQTGKCVVITGGFHTSALLTMNKVSTQKEETANAKQQQAKKTKVKNTVINTVIKEASSSSEEDRNWIIRYSYDQLDSLNGYAAGMPSPAYYQTLWQSLQKGEQDFLDQACSAKLIEIAHDNRTQKLTSIISSSEVQAALYHAKQLAALRGCSGPGRSEISDAVKSCYVKESVDRAASLLADVRRIMCGDQLGDIPSNTKRPPLLKETWERGQSLGLKFDQTQIKELDLDIYKNERHRNISRFFHLLSFCDIKLAAWQAGPNFVAGSNLGLMREHWCYAWTPQIESELLLRVSHGSSLEGIAQAKLEEQEKTIEDVNNAYRSKSAAALLVQACTMGMHNYVGVVSQRLASMIAEDENISSLTACGFHLLTLSKGQLVLESHKLDLELDPYIQQCWQNSVYLISRLEELNEESEEQGLTALVELYAFSRELNNDEVVANEQFDEQPYDQFYEQLKSLLQRKAARAAIRGAAMGILFQSGQITQTELQDYLSVFLQDMQDQELVLGILYGLIFTSREILWRLPNVLEHINKSIAVWDEAYFLQVLPNLRRLFSLLTPLEIDKIAGKLVEVNQLNLSVDKLTESQIGFSAEELALFPIIDTFAKDSVAKTRASKISVASIDTSEKYDAGN